MKTRRIPQEKLLSMDEFVSQLDVKRPNVQWWIKTGKLVPLSIGGRKFSSEQVGEQESLVKQVTKHLFTERMLHLAQCKMFPIVPTAAERRYINSLVTRNEAYALFGHQCGVDAFLKFVKDKEVVVIGSIRLFNRIHLQTEFMASKLSNGPRRRGHPMTDSKIVDKVLALSKQGMPRAEIARQLSSEIGHMSVYRIIAREKRRKEVTG